MLIITGGAGFIGSNLAAALEKSGIGPVVICDVLGTGAKWKNISKRALDDLITPDDLPYFLEENKKRIDAIFHMGAISATTETDADKIIATNFRLSRDLFIWCTLNRKRLIYASSAATYGNGEAGFIDNDDMAYLKQLRPLNPYGWSKHLFDQYVAQHAQAAPPQIAGLKFFNVYGPNEYHKEGQRSVAHQVFERAVKGESFALFKSHNPAYPDGGQKRDFVWVGDCVAIMLWLLDNPRISGLYNVGSGAARPFIDLASAVYRALGKEPNISFTDTPPQLRAHYQYFTEGPLQKLRDAGYGKPLTTLEDGINAYVNDYLVKPDPYC